MWEQVPSPLKSSNQSGTGPIASTAVGVAAILAGNLVPPLGAVIVLLWAAFTKTPTRELGLGQPAGWPSTIAFGLVIGVALKLTMKAMIMPLLGHAVFDVTAVVLIYFDWEHTVAGWWLHP